MTDANGPACDSKRKIRRSPCVYIGVTDMTHLPPMRLDCAGRPEARQQVPDGLAAAYYLHFVQLVRLARQLVDDTDTAEEVVQDVFVRLKRRGQPSAPSLAYLRAAVLNQSRSVLRRRRLVRRHDAVRLTPELPLSDVAVGVAERDLIRRAIAGLPARQREVLVLRYYEDLPLQEIAATLGISVNATSAAISRALDSISDALKVDS